MNVATAIGGHVGPSIERAPLVQLHNIVKRYGNHTVLDGINLTIGEGEFFTLLGPSGSGKTTMLRLISGFDQPDEGSIVIDQEDVADTPPYLRDVNTVFQDYALFPHLTVLQNIAYGPLAKKMPKAEAMERSIAALEMVKLATVGHRKPAELSGGQRQRIAMARAIVNRPRVLLLDEPLGALDLKLRHEMQFELQRMQRELGITFIYVTHDQEEALAMSDRIAVFEQGRIAQLDRPCDLYERPASRFVAAFVGVSNIITVDGQCFMIRPERIALQRASAQHGYPAVAGTIEEIVYQGPLTRYLLATDNGERLNVAALNRSDIGAEAAWQRGERAWATWNLVDMVPMA
jgi:putative spermidine/putrescine transport system ATP-binding protein